MTRTKIVTDVIYNYFPEPHASLLSGILFGVDLEKGSEFYTQVKITGLLHIVVLSGINITLLGALVAILTRPLGRKASAGISIAAIAAFVWFVGADPPVTRAAIMGSLSLLAIVFERKSLPLYLLFLSGLAIAIWRFEWLETVSFQLSFGATLGIILWGDVGKMDERGTFNKVKAFLYKELKPTFAAQVITTPIIFWYFRELSIIAPLANLVVAFAIPPLMLYGFLTTVLGLIHPALGLLPSYVCYALLHYIIMSIDVLARIPNIFFVLK